MAIRKTIRSKSSMEVVATGMNDIRCEVCKKEFSIKEAINIDCSEAKCPLTKMIDRKDSDGQ